MNRGILTVGGWLATALVSACGPAHVGRDTDAGSIDGGSETTDAGDDRRDAGPRFDRCRPTLGTGMPGACADRAPPDSFEPEVQWTWDGTADGVPDSAQIPLVANLTDDNDDGSVDVCDVPDVIVLAANFDAQHLPGFLYVLDGATGSVHFKVSEPVDWAVTPAIGDIDGDRAPEIVAVTPDDRLISFNHDGSVAWRAAEPWIGSHHSQCVGEGAAGSIALADMDNDGDVEILLGETLMDHEGNHLWTAPQVAGLCSATVAADLDGDGDLEMVLGHAAYHHDGTELWVAPGVSPGFPQIADFDMDGLPEILVTNANGLSLIKHDGTVVYSGRRPMDGIGNGDLIWTRPATIHDFDGDGAPELAVSSGNNYSVYEADLTVVWSAVVSDMTGIAAGTAFDFLGDGTAEAMYADEHNLFVFDSEGAPLVTVPRGSLTLTEYPVVADIDDDGSAEILVVSNKTLDGARTAPTLQAIRDREDRWIQARRIWNQHTYHVTNVLEDGTIPQHERPHWQTFNTFRTNAQIESGAVCQPLI